jgi:hypothetical protein
MPFGKKTDAAGLTIDFDAVYESVIKPAILDAGLGVFVFTGSSLAQRSFREIVAFVLGVTDAILDKARTTKRPFIWGISDRRVFDRLDRS